MKKMNGRTVKGFTLVELIVVLAIIGILAGLLAPTLLGYTRRAKIAAVITDAQTIKSAVENSLVQKFGSAENKDDPSAAFEKQIQTQDKKTKKIIDAKTVGCFTSWSWDNFKQNGGKLDGQTGSNLVDGIIAGALDDAVSEKWETGKKIHPMNYNSKTNNCAKFLSDNHTNFGIIVIYDIDYNVVFMQIYRKGILVTYINGEYIANTSSDACFIGNNDFSTIYEDVGKDGSHLHEDLYKVYLANGKYKPDGTKKGGWY